MQASIPSAEQWPWQRALLWLLLLGPFFFLSYGFSNWLAAQQAQVAVIVFDWEHYIPFMEWTIIPYWVIDLLYVISLFICTSRHQLDTHAKRLLTAQLIAVVCFISFPLGFSFERPETHGMLGSMYTLLESFDQPYNQAPSLHIALLVILWVLYTRQLPKWLPWPFHILSALIAISVLTTYQHHFIDIPTGVLLGWFSVWLWPDKEQKEERTEAQAMHHLRSSSQRQQSLRLTSYYLFGASLFALVGFTTGNAALWLLWPAVALLFVALFYAFIGPAGFQKNSQGQMSLAVKWMLSPYLLATRLNSRIWTRNDKAAVEICEGVWLGRFPSTTELDNHKYKSVVDMTAEFPAPATEINWHTISSLDLLVPAENDLLRAAELIEHARSKGPVLVCCALGYSRSALAVVTWLLVTRRVTSMNEAMQQVREKRPAVVFNKTGTDVIEGLARTQFGESS